jgi:hypothetical protein
VTRIGRDGINLATIPVAGTQLVLVYANGSYQARPADVVARFGNIPVVWIDVNGKCPWADVLDVEQYNATPAQVPGWIADHRVMHPGGYPPVIYVNRSNITAVFNAVQARGYRPGHEFNLWISTLDGTNHVADMTGVAAVQYVEHPGYDESVVYDDRWKPGAGA